MFSVYLEEEKNEEKKECLNLVFGCEKYLKGFRCDFTMNLNPKLLSFFGLNYMQTIHLER